MATSLPNVVPVFALRDGHVRTPAAVRAVSRRRAQAWMRHHVLGETLFKDALVRERKRGDRFGTAFAVLLLDRIGVSNGGDPWIPFVRALAAVKRDIDVMGWVQQPAVLGLLLPEVTRDGALKVIERLRAAIARQLDDDGESVSIRLYVHAAADESEDAEAGPPLESLVPHRGHPWRDAAKRALDIAGSVFLLTLFSPVMLASFIAVKCTSPGPALYRQVRIGRKGQQFRMLKFRSMYQNSGHGIHQEYVSWFIKSSGKQPRNGDEVFKLTNDPRITSVGHFLRKTSLDELPQFWNVLRGDMSLVGPRPPLPFEVEQYQAWHRRRVVEAKPGVTGPWQINGRSRTTFDDMVRLDLRYARMHSLWTDIKILAATPRAMVSGKGAC